MGLQDRVCECVCVSVSVSVCVLVSQSCLTLCDPMVWSLPGSLFIGFSSEEHWSGLNPPNLP